MILTQHYLACLSQASYLLADETTGRAVVVDPRRDIGIYLDEAAEKGLRIERVIETHVHADFLSGHLELADRTGAVISYGAGARVNFPVELLEDGQRLSLGDVTLEVLSTPGHTPESICLVVWEHGDDAAPYGVLTGDTLFVGDVGRPDLLSSFGGESPGEDTGQEDGAARPTTPAPERSAWENSAEALARQLYKSLHTKLLVLPDTTRVFPAHGAGSSCGKQLSSETMSTIGEQRRDNYALQYTAEKDFVSAVTEGQPARPLYFEFDARANRELHPLFDDAEPPMLLLDEVLALQASGAVLLDPREPADFAAGHLRGALNVGLQGRFAEWAGDVLPPDRDIVLVGDPAISREAKVRLARVGLDRVVGQLARPAEAFADRPSAVSTSSRLSPAQLASLVSAEAGLQVVDIRSHSETSEGKVPGAEEIPLATLRASLGKLQRAKPVVVYCASGYRSQVAASLLRQAGFDDVSDLVGGYGAWVAAGFAQHQPDPATPR